MSKYILKNKFSETTIVVEVKKRSDVKDWFDYNLPCENWTDWKLIATVGTLTAKKTDEQNSI